MDKIAMLKEILAQNPNDTFARYGLAMEHANQGDTATASSSSRLAGTARRVSAWKPVLPPRAAPATRSR
jgi:cytochrome c-type biogenesis protein CcmH/NrfG